MGAWMSDAGIAVQKKSENVWEIRIRGMLKKAEFDSVQAKAREEIAKTGKIRMLVILDDFLGWEPGTDWGDMSFFYEHGDDIEKIAIVGDPKWEQKALMFAGAGLRAGPVRFFPASELEQASKWLR